MNDLKTFDFSGAAVRVCIVNGEPWWVLKDVCDVLGIVDHHQVFERLDDDERGRYSAPTNGGAQEMKCVNESGLYSAILRSDKPETKAFRKWITAEVLPAIRRHGAYVVPGTGTAAPALLPDFSNPAAAARAWADEWDRRKTAESRIRLLEPKAEAADRISGAEGLRTITQIGKINGIGPRKLFDLLSELGIIYRQRGAWVPYQNYIDAGHFIVRESTYTTPDGVEHLSPQTYVTGKGELWLARQLFAKRPLEEQLV